MGRDSTQDEMHMDPTQKQLVDRACETWIRRLVDHSRNNTLLFFRHLKIGTLDLTELTNITSDLLSGKRITLDHLTKAYIGQMADEDEDERVEVKTRRKIVAIQRKALTNSEERGLDTLFLAVGLATWPATDRGRPYSAPVLLLPVKIDQKKGGALSFQLAGEPQPNIVLHYVLEQNHNISIDPDALIKASIAETDKGWQVDVEAAFEHLKNGAAELSGFSIERAFALGNFQFAKMAIVEDLRKNREHLIQHPVIAAIANHAPSREAIASRGEDVDPRHLDDTPPSDEHLVLDADSSQQATIATICSGRSGVIQGPPGTGKSQTIANLIAELTARGKRVLFVAEKRAALDAVLKRLEEVGLGHLALDLHGASISRKAVMGRIKDALQAIHDSTPPAIGDGFELLADRRQRLNGHAERVNRQQGPLSMSICELQGELLRATESAQTSVRLGDAALAHISESGINEYRVLLNEASSHNELFLGTSSSGWNEAQVETGEAVRDLLENIRSVLFESLPETNQCVASLGSSLEIDPRERIDECIQIAGVLEKLTQFCDRYSLGIFDESTIEDAAQQLKHGTTNWWWTILKTVFSPEFRAARNTFRRYRKEPAKSKVLSAEAEEACRILRAWTEMNPESNTPFLPNEAADYSSAIRKLESKLDHLSSILPSLHYDGTVDSLHIALEQLAGEEATAYALPRIYELRKIMREAELSGLLEDLRRRPCSPEMWGARLDFVFHRSALDAILMQSPELAAFQGSHHSQQVSEFADLDRRHLGVTATRIKRLHGERAIAAMNQHPTQRDLVKREANKSSRHISLRRLLADAPDVLTRIAPCWVASPLSVSQLLDGGSKYFDVVVFDEASQILPEDAIAAIMRGEQVVVAGDRHQLPPTTFFAGAADEGEEEEELEATSGFESLLDSLSAFLPNWLLEWHYRSQDERLIAFSNAQIYDGRLITFPGTLGDDVISHIEIPFVRGVTSQEESASAEVEKVVELVIQHAEQNLDLIAEDQKSLGVITMGIRHANRVQAALDRALEDRPELLEFFSMEKAERFFVKNLETVQGDERDAIILSIGYGKNPEGDLPHRFGPLTQDVGYRRLNVAVTRARLQMTVVSSFSHHEVNLERSGSRGVQLLKAYLEYAGSGGRDMQLGTGETGFPLNAFEADIKDALEARGMNLLSQYGASRYRIDLVATDPDDVTRPILAIECDGASYHSSATARERDRLRQEHLMRLGWRFHRIWSTDWFNHREEEVDRAIAAFRNAVERDGLDSPQPTQVQNALDSENGRGPVPHLSERKDITKYPEAELTELAQWAMSDGKLRTDKELIRDMLKPLPFTKLGPRIEKHLQSAIDRARQNNGETS